MRILILSSAKESVPTPFFWGDFFAVCRFPPAARMAGHAKNGILFIRIYSQVSVSAESRVPV
ncbi:MAG: hypothetical protein DBX55_03135 [Verrucomicrobia bacterium]|nr:MAG: hypothetical protein DBX55_03135 [Verrucomicrobiota bacterium]